MGFYQDQIVPRFVNVALGLREFDPLRERVAAGLEGRVLEVGFGSGLNVPHYPTEVTSVVAADPSTVGRQLAAKRIAQSPIPIDFVGLDGQQIPLPEDSVDHVLTTWTLCTIPDARAALGEIRRVLRPGGTFHFLEHGLSPDPKVARWQDRLTPLQRRLAAGCHLNRPIGELVDHDGFEVTYLDTYYVTGPKVFGYMFEGAATPS